MACARSEERPILDDRNSRALTVFLSLFNAATREFPGAWEIWYRHTPIQVDDEWEAQYFLRAWGAFYAAVRDIAQERLKRERRNEDLMQQRARLRVN